jgi:phospholipase C
VLAGTVWGIAGLAGGTALGAALPRATVAESELPERPGGTGFDHLVVLAFENRSFDNLFGYLYSSLGHPVPAGQSFEGLEGGARFNLAPDGTRVDAHPYSGSTDAIMASPSPNAGEEYAHINTQLFGIVDPPANATATVPQAPYNAPPPGTKPSMSGFVTDYINNHAAKTGALLTPDEYGAIMGSFTPDMLPVFSTLARSFAIYDHWHASVPTQTFANRSFMHASTSSGFVENKGVQGFGKWIDPALNDAPTVFNQLDEAGVSWAVYFDESQLISFTGLIHAARLQPYWRTNFRTMTQFHADVAAGTLPAYSFIEPRLIYNHNDMHPATEAVTEQTVEGKVILGSGFSDARAGEQLLHEVYTSIRKSSAVKGSNALNTMFFVTFDETGGTYDHVPPPAAEPPGDGAPGELGFGFDRLGARVPALAISAYTPAGAVINDEMHHGAIPSTLRARWGLKPLTERDRHAATLSSAATLPAPRQPSTWPVTTSHYVPLNPEAPSAAVGAKPNAALTPPAVGLLSVLLAKYGQPGDPIPKTYADATELLEKHGRELFGT